MLAKSDIPMGLRDAPDGVYAVVGYLKRYAPVRSTVRQLARLGRQGVLAKEYARIQAETLEKLAKQGEEVSLNP